jgi:hypothetical protein
LPNFVSIVFTVPTLPLTWPMIPFLNFAIVLNLIINKFQRNASIGNLSVSWPLSRCDARLFTRCKDNTKKNELYTLLVKSYVNIIYLYFFNSIIII